MWAWAHLILTAQRIDCCGTPHYTRSNLIWAWRFCSHILPFVYRIAYKSRRKEDSMDNFLLLKIIGTNTYNGTSRNGKPYTLTTLELDFEGEKVRLKCFEKDVNVGDFAQVSIGVRKTVYGAELAVVLDKVIPAAEIEDNWK